MSDHAWGVPGANARASRPNTWSGTRLDGANMARHEGWPLARPRTERDVAFTVLLAFLAAGGLWILFTDLLLYSFVDSQPIIARIETAKGGAFVAVSALIIYTVTRRSAASVRKASDTTAAVVESIGEGVLLLGADRTIAYANPAAVRMLRAETAGDLCGMGAREFSRRFHVSFPDGQLVAPERFASQRVFEEAGPLRYLEVLHPPGGPEVVIACTAAAVRTEPDEPADLVVSIMRDITVPEQLERLRDELFTSAAHAIKTPVAVIKSAAQVLTAEAPSRPAESRAIIERQCARIEQLVDNIFVLSRIRSGTLQLHHADVELAPVVEGAVRDVARLAPRHDLRIQTDGQPLVRADRERLTMAIRNVVLGATRLSVPGGPVLVQLARHGEDAEVAVGFQATAPGVRDAAARHDGELDDLGISRYVTKVILEAHLGSLIEQLDAPDAAIRIVLPALPEPAR